MKNLESLKKRGIPIRKLNTVMLIVAIFVSLILFVAMQMTNSIYNEIKDATSKLLTLRKDAYNLQIASDYLTEQMRCFVVSGKKLYLDNYFKEAFETKRRERALEDIKQYHDNANSYKELKEAMNESVKLMDVEYYAARLAVEGYGFDLQAYPEAVRNVVLSAEDDALSEEGKKNKACELMFNDEYLNSKNNISSDMDACLANLESEIDKEQNEMADKLHGQVFIEHLLTVLLIFIVLGIVIVTSVLVFRPLNKCVALMRKEEEIPVNGAYEIRFLAKNYNLMYYTNIESKKKLGHEATHDKLTGLYNRRGYEFLLQNVDMETSTLLIIDLDEFKSINDTHGHDVGDEVLKKAAKTIINSFRSQDYICRIGGDEFAVIMIRSDSSMKDLIARKINMINEKLSVSDENDNPPVSCSVGVAFGRIGLNVSDMFKRADTALYETKKNGRCGVTFFGNEKSA